MHIHTYLCGRVLLIIGNLCIKRANFIAFNQEAPNYRNGCIEIAAVAGHNGVKYCLNKHNKNH